MAVVHPAHAALLALTLAAVTTPAGARVHRHAHGKAATHHTTGHHQTSHHHERGHHPAKAATRHASREPAKPAGVTGIPAGGMKLYCPAGRNPLLIRKSTQGAGTTVTVVCR